MKPKDIDKKYNLEDIFMETYLSITEQDDQLKDLHNTLESIAPYVDKLNGFLCNPVNTEEIETIVNECYGVMNDINVKYQFNIEIDRISTESGRLQPFTLLNHSVEDITETIKNILFKLKQIFLFIGRHISQLIKKIGWALLDIPGDAKILRDKIIQNLTPTDKINEKYGGKFLTWVKTYYPSLLYLTSPSVGKYSGANGLSRLIFILGENEINLNIPNLSDLAVGDSDKFSEELLSYFRNGKMDVSDLIFARKDLIKSNILSIEGINLNKYEDVEVFIYCVDAKFIYYFIICKKSNGSIKTIVSKSRIETFRSPQIRAVNISPLECNLIIGNNPIDFCNILIDEIIVNSPKVHKIVNRIPGKIKELEDTLNHNIKLFEAKGQTGDIVLNLKTYSNFLKNLFRTYFSDILSSKLHTYLFYYKLSSIVYASVLGSKTS